MIPRNSRVVVVAKQSTVDVPTYSRMRGNADVTKDTSDLGSLTSFSFNFHCRFRAEHGRGQVGSYHQEMPGMSISMPEVTSAQCLTKKDFVPQGYQQGQECKITKTKVDGNTVTWTGKCSGQGVEMTGTGRMKYSGSSFKGTIKMTMVQSNTKMISHIKGHRIGDCE
jgi:hypothetical protein